MRAKLGLPADVDGGVVTPLVDELLRLLKESHVDYTSFFRHLGRAARGDTGPARGLFADLAGFDGWMSRWRALGPDADIMDRANPVYIPATIWWRKHWPWRRRATSARSGSFSTR